MGEDLFAVVRPNGDMITILEGILCGTCVCVCVCMYVRILTWAPGVGLVVGAANECYLCYCSDQ